jgi:hypothetical protein
MHYFLSFIGFGWVCIILPLIWLRNKIFNDPYNGNEGSFIEFYAICAIAGIATVIGFGFLATTISLQTFLLWLTGYLVVTMISIFFYFAVL